MNIPTCQNLATRLLQLFTLLQLFSQLVVQSVSQPCLSDQTPTAIGIHIDDYDRFAIAIANETSHIGTFVRGYFDVHDSGSVRAILAEYPPSLREKGKVRAALETMGGQAAKLLQDALKELQKLPVTGGHHDTCAITSTSFLPDSQSSLVVSLLREVFECPEVALHFSAVTSIVAAVYIRPHDVEEASAAIVDPSGYTYIIGEESVLVTLDVLPPPFDLENLSSYTINRLIILRGDGTTPFGQFYGPSDIQIQYEHPDIIARGAALQVSYSFCQEPVEVIPLAIGVVLHSSLSHIVVPHISILPAHANIVLTTVHDGQTTVVIDLRKGHRPRAEDTLPLIQLVLEGIPPAPAGIPQIQLSISVDKYATDITIEAVEPLSGVQARKVVEQPFTYGDGTEYNRVQYEHKEEDLELRARADGWILRGNEQHPHAIQLFNGKHGHDEL